MLPIRTHVAILLLLASTRLTVPAGAETEATNNPYRQTTLVRGESYKLECPVEQLDGATLVEWYSSGERIHSQYDRYSVTQKGVLHIRNVQLEDTGNFTCKAVNGFGSASFTIGLIVVKNANDQTEPQIPTSTHPDGPSFINTARMRPATIEAVVGTSVELFCKASGYPTPNVTWTRSDLSPPRPLTAYRRTQRGLQINSVSMADSGRYTCQARNEFGEIQYTYTLIVRTNMPLVPVFNRTNRNITTSRRASADLTCITTSEASPQIVWLKRRARQNVTLPPDAAGVVAPSDLPPALIGTIDDYVYLRVADDDPRFDTAEQVYISVHTIERAELSDAGTYLCVAKNVHGSSSREVYLRVVGDNGTVYDEDPSPLLPPTPSRATTPSLRQPMSNALRSTTPLSVQAGQPAPHDAAVFEADVFDHSNIMLVVYILVPLLVIIGSLAIVIYYMRSRERTKRKRLRAAVIVQTHHAGAKSASNSSASLSTSRQPPSCPAVPLSQLGSTAKMPPRDYAVLNGGHAQLRLSPRSSGFTASGQHPMWTGNPQPPVHAQLYPDAQTMLPLLPQYPYTADSVALPYEYYPAASHSCSHTPNHQFNAGCLPCAYDYAAAAAAGYPVGAPLYANNVNTLSTQHSANAYNAQSHNAHSSTSASYTSVRMSPT